MTAIASDTGQGVTAIAAFTPCRAILPHGARVTVTAVTALSAIAVGASSSQSTSLASIRSGSTVAPMSSGIT